MTHRECIDSEYIEKLLSEAREALEELKSITTRSLTEVLSSRDLRYAMRFSIILVVEALTDIAQHILVRCFSIELKSYSDAMEKLCEVGIVRKELVRGLVNLAKLRNLIIHRYWEVDDLRIYNEARSSSIATIENAIDDIHRWVDDT